MRQIYNKTAPFVKKTPGVENDEGTPVKWTPYFTGHKVTKN